MSAERFEIEFHVLNQWLALRQNGLTLQAYFEDYLIECAAIYGMGLVGNRLLEELRQIPIRVPYAVDRMADKKKVPGLKLYHAEVSELPAADVMIVTPMREYWAIVDAMRKITDIPIISLEDVVSYCAAHR